MINIFVQKHVTRWNFIWLLRQFLSELVCKTFNSLYQLMFRAMFFKMALVDREIYRCFKSYIKSIFCIILRSGKVILIELTSPCEENFEDRHFDKIGRYEALCVSIRENGCRHHLFAIEVGARGYCAYNVRSCFRRLGLNTKETKVVLSEIT